MRRATLLALLLAVVTVHSNALAATAEVDMVGSTFNPGSVKVNAGDTVRWTNQDFESHTSTSNGFFGTIGVALWNSGTVGPGGTFSFTFTTAGKYLYFCNIHAFMRGSVTVKMRARPRTGTVATTYRISWAAGNGIPAGFNADVQMKRPGSSSFVDWMVDRTGSSTSADFVPDAGAGTYSFRTRLQRDSTGAASAFSPAASIVVE